jgi:hypothetical protein
VHSSPGGHIWRGRGTSGRETDGHATSRLRQNGKRRRLAALDAAALRVLLAWDEALVMAEAVA